VIENAQTLLRELDARGVPVHFRAKGYTMLHQVLLDLEPNHAERFKDQMEETGIFIDTWGRVDTSEVTRRGMGKDEMEKIAALVAEVFHHGPREELKGRVRELAIRELADSFRAPIR
jgi:glycine hydroxymethyltransferase